MRTIGLAVGVLSVIVGGHLVAGEPALRTAYVGLPHGGVHQAFAIPSPAIERTCGCGGPADPAVAGLWDGYARPSIGRHVAPAAGWGVGGCGLGGACGAECGCGDGFGHHLGNGQGFGDGLGLNLGFRDRAYGVVPVVGAGCGCGG